MATEHIDVAIVGGGISGLSAAFMLFKKGVPFILLEASSRFGGVIQTETAAGFLLEGGPDSILAHKPEGIGLCHELGLGPHLIPTNTHDRKVYILHKHSLHPFPEGMVLGIPTQISSLLKSRLFSLSGKLRMGFDLVIPTQTDSADESIAAFIRRRLGNEALERIGEPLLAGIHMGDPEKLSLQATFPRLATLEARYGSVIRGMWATAPKDQTKAAFYSLTGGLQELVAALVSRLPEEQLRKKSSLRSIDRDRSGIYQLHLENGIAIAARVVILAIPSPNTAPLIAPLSPAIADILRTIPFASSATVLLGYRRLDVHHPLDGYGLLVPRTEGLQTTACGFSSTKFLGRAPKDHVLLRAFLGGARGPEILKHDDQELIQLAQAEMAPPLGLKKAPVLARAFRWPHATPQMQIGHLERMESLEQQLSTLPGLFLTGAGLRGTGIPDAIAESQRVAQRAAEWLTAPVSSS